MVRGIYFDCDLEKLIIKINWRQAPENPKQFFAMVVGALTI